MRTLFCVYLGSGLLALVITPLVILLARRIKAVDRPGVRTVHTRVVPRIGGMAIFLSATPLIVAVLFLNNSVGEAFRQARLQLVTLFCSATFIFLIGLVDDLKGLPARFKFGAEFLAAGSLCFAGVRVSSIAVTGQWTLHLGLLGCPLSILWIIGITNAVNLSDGLDGLAAGISAIVCAVIALFAFQSGSIIMLVLMLSLLGSLTGFLFFNFNPARIFLGDCGSLFLGFTVASASILCSMKSSALVSLALPLLALGIPIFDTLFSILRRFLERRSIFAPDRGHFHHRLIDMGLKQRHVVILIYAMTSVVTGLGMLMMLTHNVSSLIVFFSVLLLLLLLFRVVCAIGLRETMSGLQRKYKIASRYKLERTNFEYAQLHFRNARTSEQWWAAVCEAARRMDCTWVSLTRKYWDGRVETDVWRTANARLAQSRVIVVTVPLSVDKGEATREFKIAVSVNGSLESAGNRATLFNRLIEEHSLSSILQAGAACGSDAESRADRDRHWVRSRLPLGLLSTPRQMNASFRNASVPYSEQKV
jgi:UDP-GlcNAc:undecaprenyl-phosphate GlcNAc-1-phosphate transferase